MPGLEDADDFVEFDEDLQLELRRLFSECENCQIRNNERFNEILQYIVESPELEETEHGEDLVNLMKTLVPGLATADVHEREQPTFERIQEEYGNWVFHDIRFSISFGRCSSDPLHGERSYDTEIAGMDWETGRNFYGVKVAADATSPEDVKRSGHYALNYSGNDTFENLCLLAGIDEDRTDVDELYENAHRVLEEQLQYDDPSALFGELEEIGAKYDIPAPTES